MKFDMKLSEFCPDIPIRVGNVYPVKGGYGTKAKHMMVLFSVAPDASALLIVLNKNGVPVGVTHYSVNALEDRMPIGFVHGLADLVFDVVPL